MGERARFTTLTIGQRYRHDTTTRVCGAAASDWSHSKPGLPLGFLHVQRFRHRSLRLDFHPAAGGAEHVHGHSAALGVRNDGLARDLVCRRPDPPLGLLPEELALERDYYFR